MKTVKYSVLIVTHAAKKKRKKKLKKRLNILCAKVKTQRKNLKV